MTYATLDDLQARLRVDGLDADETALYERALAAATALIDEYTGRSFTAAGTATTVRYYGGEFGRTLDIDDLGSLTGLLVEVDDGDTGTYDTTVPATDLLTEPANALADGNPITRLVLRTSSALVRWPGYNGQDVRIAARWGWPAVPDAIVEACLLQATRLVRRRDAPFGVIDSPAAGVTDRLYAMLDPDAELLLKPYRRVLNVGYGY